MSDELSTLIYASRKISAVRFRQPHDMVTKTVVGGTKRKEGLEHEAHVDIWWVSEQQMRTA